MFGAVADRRNRPDFPTRRRRVVLGPSTRRCPRMRKVIVTSVAALLTAAVVLVITQQTRADDTVDAPAPGSVAADWVDGEPVWVVHDETGDVSVLDAVNPHSRFGVDELVGWCESSGWFEAGGDGSRFDGQGRYAFGPVPHGLVTYDVVRVGDGRARVGQPREPSPRGEAYDDPVGPHCGYSLDQSQHPVARYHPVEGSGRELFEGVVVAGDKGEAFFCSREDVVDGRCPDDALVVPEITSLPDAGLLRGSFLARQYDDTLRDVVYLPDGYQSP